MLSASIPSLDPKRTSVSNLGMVQNTALEFSNVISRATDLLDRCNVPQLTALYLF
jgi:hypothetical protein